MASNRFIKRSAACAIIIAGFAAATPANAGRCGYSYPVDAPTTLGKVARACNVSLSALREANPGVDPANVRPGQHLAVPDEIDTAHASTAQTTVQSAVSDPQTSSADQSEQGAHPYIVSRPVNTYRAYYDDTVSDEVVPVSRANSVTPLATSYYLQGGGEGFERRHTRDDERLSYQKQSANRIRNAGIKVNKGPLGGAFTKPGGIQTIAAPAIPVMECAVIQRQADGKIQQVREFKPMAPGRKTPVHCIAMTADAAPMPPTATSAAPTEIAVTRATHPMLRANYQQSAHVGVLKGFVSAVDASCVAIRTHDGVTRTVSTTQDARSLLEMNATLWVKQSPTAECGGLVMTHAVYAERL